VSAPPSRARFIGRAALVWFALSTALLVAPLYTWLGNSIEPRVLGLPWSLAYVLGIVLVNSCVLAMLYVGRWIDHAELE